MSENQRYTPPHDPISECRDILAECRKSLAPQRDDLIGIVYPWQETPAFSRKGLEAALGVESTPYDMATLLLSTNEVSEMPSLVSLRLHGSKNRLSAPPIIQTRDRSSYIIAGDSSSRTLQALPTLLTEYLHSIGVEPTPKAELTQDYNTWIHKTASLDGRKPRDGKRRDGRHFKLYDPSWDIRLSRQLNGGDGYSGEEVFAAYRSIKRRSFSKEMCQIILRQLAIIDDDLHYATRAVVFDVDSHDIVAPPPYAMTQFRPLGIDSGSHIQRRQDVGEPVRQIAQLILNQLCQNS